MINVRDYKKWIYMCVVGGAYIIGGQGVIVYLLLDWGVWHGIPLEFVCNNHSIAPIYGGYQPQIGGVCCGALHTLGAASASCLSYVWL